MDETVIGDLEAFGAPAELRERLAGAAAPEAGFPIWPDVAPAAAAFLACQSQWVVQIVAGLKRSRVIYIGLNYTGVESALRLAGLAVTPPQFADLRVMEGTAIEALNSR